MKDQIKSLLFEIADDFFTKINIDEYVEKIFEKATIIPIINNSNITSFIAFYCNDISTRTAFLTMIAVRKDYRNKGVGRFLINTAIDFLKNAKFNTFQLEVSKQNFYAFKLYKEIGFEVFHEMELSFLMKLQLM